MYITSNMKGIKTGKTCKNHNLEKTDLAWSKVLDRGVVDNESCFLKFEI